MPPIRVAAPAKINLFLHVTGKRPDGYHEIVSLMCPVALYDRLTIRFGGGGIRVSCPHPDVPEDSSNLAARAARLFLDAVFSPDDPAPGIQLHIEKQIPVGAGLGGGSSDAAAVLTALNRRFDSPLSQTALSALGARIGADVPFFIGGVPALATGVGDQLAPVENLTPRTALLVYPNQVVSTAWVYKNLNLRLTKDEKKLSKFHFNGRFFSVDAHLVNDLEAVTAKAFPVVNEIKRLLLAHGASGALMSGSGSTVFGLFPGNREAVSAHTALGRHPTCRAWGLYVADFLIGSTVGS